MTSLILNNTFQEQLVLYTYGVTGIGPQGARGLQGYDGIQGAVGTIGLQGRQGVQGEGVQGVQGFIGVSVTGAQGVEGLQGTSGQQGFQGFQGTLGFQGIVGSNGSAGINGTQGVQGVQGLQGSSSGTIASNTQTVTFPAPGLSNPNVATINHGLGVTPRSIVVCDASAIVNNVLFLGIVSKNSTSFTFTAANDDFGTFAGTRTVSWIAIA